MKWMRQTLDSHGVAILVRLVVGAVFLSEGIQKYLARKKQGGDS